MLEKLTAKIAEQQKGRENTVVYMVGEQIKDICRKFPKAAEIVLHDLDISEMSIETAAKKIRKYADKQPRKENCVCVPPNVAENIIMEFYGLGGLPESVSESSEPPETAKSVKDRKILNLADFL